MAANAMTAAAAEAGCSAAELRVDEQAYAGAGAGALGVRVIAPGVPASQRSKVSFDQPVTQAMCSCGLVAKRQPGRAGESPESGWLTARPEASCAGRTYQLEAAHDPLHSWLAKADTQSGRALSRLPGR